MTEIFESERPIAQNSDNHRLDQSLFCGIFDSGNGGLVLSLFSHLLSHKPRPHDPDGQSKTNAQQENTRRLGIRLKRLPCMWSPKRRNIHEIDSMQFS